MVEYFPQEIEAALQPVMVCRAEANRIELQLAQAVRWIPGDCILLHGPSLVVAEIISIQASSQAPGGAHGQPRESSFANTEPSADVRCTVMANVQAGRCALGRYQAQHVSHSLLAQQLPNLLQALAPSPNNPVQGQALSLPGNVSVYPSAWQSFIHISAQPVQQTAFFLISLLAQLRQALSSNASISTSASTKESATTTSPEASLDTESPTSVPPRAIILDGLGLVHPQATVDLLDPLEPLRFVRLGSDTGLSLREYGLQRLLDGLLSQLPASLHEEACVLLGGVLSQSMHPETWLSPTQLLDVLEPELDDDMPAKPLVADLLTHLEHSGLFAAKPRKSLSVARMLPKAGHITWVDATALGDPWRQWATEYIVSQLYKLKPSEQAPCILVCILPEKGLKTPEQTLRPLYEAGFLLITVSPTPGFAEGFTPDNQVHLQAASQAGRPYSHYNIRWQGTWTHQLPLAWQASATHTASAPRQDAPPSVPVVPLQEEAPVEAPTTDYPTVELSEMLPVATTAFGPPPTIPPEAPDFAQPQAQTQPSAHTEASPVTDPFQPDPLEPGLPPADATPQTDLEALEDLGIYVPFAFEDLSMEDEPTPAPKTSPPASSASSFQPAESQAATTTSGSEVTPSYDTTGPHTHEPDPSGLSSWDPDPALWEPEPTPSPEEAFGPTEAEPRWDLFAFEAQDNLPEADWLPELPPLHALQPPNTFMPESAEVASGEGIEAAEERLTDERRANTPPPGQQQDLLDGLEALYPEGYFNPNQPLDPSLTVPEPARPSEESQAIDSMINQVLLGGHVAPPEHAQPGQAQAAPGQPTAAHHPTAQETTFKAGDRVSHPTYGQGVVQKVMPMEDRTVLTVQFQQVGKRLLDPTLSQLQPLP
ncbi:MAG: hypothetical protein SFZ03_07120 [Candidatus Melainabacteria bacterium]|nr:hypothetical protein [Candidatus Melainabacteria bacterium]